MIPLKHAGIRTSTEKVFDVLVLTTTTVRFLMTLVLRNSHSSVAGLHFPCAHLE